MNEIEADKTGHLRIQLETPVAITAMIVTGILTGLKIFINAKYNRITDISHNEKMTSYTNYPIIV